ncbi:MAG: tetratricopeptide repeat protein [Burkholderiales bacterium]
MTRALRILAAAVALGAPLTALADAAVTQPVTNPDFELGFEAIKAKDWDQAVSYLSRYVNVDPVSADAQNLLGYAYRNQKKYDLAFRHYKEALRIDPKHKGAHEYIGETYLLVGDKAKAQEHLEALERICTRRCDEYQDLARAIAQAK